MTINGGDIEYYKDGSLVQTSSGASGEYYITVGIADNGSNNVVSATIDSYTASSTSTVTPTFEAGKVGTQALVSPQMSVVAKPLTSPGAVSIASNAFSPTPLSIQTGSTVTWTNNETAGSNNYNGAATWDASTSQNININGDTIDTTNAGWSNYIQSTQTDITSGTIEVTSDFYSDGRGMVGFGQGPLGDNTTLDFGCYGTDSSTALMFMENGSVVHTVPSYTYTSSDICKIEIESDGTVKYYVNTDLKYTSSNTASGEYYVQAVLNKFAGGTTPSASVDLDYDIPTGIHQVESTTLVNNASTQGDKFPVDVSTGVIDYTGHGTSEHHSVSAKLPSVAQDQWVLRFEHTVDSTIGTSNGDVNVFIGVGDDPTKHFQEDQDWIGTRLLLSANTGGSYGLVRPNSVDDSAPQSGQCNNYWGYMGSGTENTKYYLEIVRDGSDYDFSISSSDSYSGDVLNVDNCSVNGTPENLQYLKFGSSAG